MRCYAFSKTGTIAGKRIFLRPVEKAGNGQHVHLRNMRHISLAAMTVLQADEGNENIIFGELDLGKKFLLCIDESGDIHDSTALPAHIKTLREHNTCGVSISHPHNATGRYYITPLKINFLSNDSPL
jgi:hypothetical protein